MLPARLRRALSLCAVSAVLLLPACAQRKPPKDELPHPKTLEELQRAMRGVLEKNHVPGAGVALVSKGELLWCGGIGKADLATRREVTCDTEFRAGSISKSFVALALLKLQEEGRINFYARLEDVAPEIPMKNAWEAQQPVRIVNLLEHTAGFDDMRFSEIYNRRGPADYPLLKVLQEHPGPQTVRWAPGTRFSYSNPGYGIAGYLIEKVSGEPFETYIQRNILDPLGITRGDFRLTDANREFLAQGYNGNPPRAVPYKNIYLRPAGEMKASPGELARLVQFFLQRGKTGEMQLFKPETIGRMEYPETTAAAQHGLRAGYGLGNYSTLEGGVVTHGHDGGIDGFLSSYRYMPEQNWGYAVLLNSSVSGKAMREINELAIDFLSKDFAKAQQPVVPLAAAELQKYAGYYAPRAPRSQRLAFLEELAGGVTVRFENGQLKRSGLLGGKPERLFPVARNLFRTEKEPEASVVFFSDDAGKAVYVDAGRSGFSYGERGSPLWPCIRLALLVLSGLLMLSALLFALVWVPRWLFGQLEGVAHLSVRGVPLLAIVALAAGIVGFLESFERLGEFNAGSLLTCVGTFFFGLLSVWGLLLALRVPKSEIRPGVRMHSLLVSVACCVATFFFGVWHLIGLRLWAP